MRNAIRSLLAAVALVAAGAVMAQAQGVSSNLNVTALVFRPLTVSGAKALDFGNVFPGVTKTVGITDGGAGRFDVTGQTNASVQLSFGLIATLGDGSGNTLPIDTWSAAHNVINDALTATGFNPAVGVSTALGVGNPGALFVFVGARVQPAGNQVGGTYTGQISMTVAYF